MEEKARLEDELILMKDYVNRLKSDMFHLKIERTNLEKEVKKTAKNIASLSESQQDDHVNIMDGYRGLRVGELSDVTEASHEDISGESENGSHVSEGNDQSSQILKSCLASMAQMYTLMPNQDDDTLTEGGESDEKDASLSENDIDDSEDDDIIITKIARGIQDYHSPVSSPTKSKKSDGMSRKSGGATSKVDNANKGTKRVNGNKDIVQAQRAHKTYQDLQVAYEDLEDELYHVRGQLSKAQQIILSLEAKLKEEKENWEKIRKLYLEYKDKNDVLEGKVGILREELEKALRENTFLKDYHQVDVVKDGQNKLYGHHSRSPTRSPSKRKVFDLRNIPSIQNSNRETQIINLLEENTELKTLNDKLAEEKVLAENLSKEKDCKLKGLETTIRFLEEEKETLKEEIETIHRRKFKVRHEGQEKQETSYSDLDVFTKECAQLEKELTLERSRAAKLQNENQKMSKDLEKMKEELKTWKNGAFKSDVIQDEDLTPTNEKSDKEKWSGNRNNAFQTVFIDDDFGSEEESKMKDHGIDSSISTADELKDLTMKLQREMISMSEYQEALEKEYGETKEETEKLKKDLQNKETMIKSLEIEISSLKRQNVAKQTGENHGTFFSRLNLKASPSKLQTTKDEFDFSKKDEMTYQDVKKYEEELNTLKKENSDLLQQITKSEQKIVIYEGDLEKAMLKIKQLQEDRLRRGIKGEVSDSDNKPTAADAEHYLAASDAKLSKTTREIERLKEQLLDKEAEKGLLYDELHLIRRRKDELDKALDEAREARTELQEKMDQMAKCTHFEDSVKELTEKNKKLVAKLQQSEETIKALTKKNEKQSEKLKSMEDDLVSTSGEKLKGDFELRNVVLEMEKAKSELQHSEQESKLLSAELNDKLEWATNLEIQLLELKCSNECMKSEIEEMKEKKRMESHQNICRETMEKRLNEAFKTNNQLQKEVQSTKDENNVMNEKLRLATERKQEVEGEVEKLKAKLGELSLEIENSSSEKKQYETKTKKLEDSRKKMDEELKRLKENIGSLQNDLQRIEKDHDDSLKKSNSLEKELRRKTKELDNKLRENRKLKKDISAMKERTATNAEGEHDGSAEIKDLKERMEELEKENEDLYARLDNIKHHDKQDGKSKHVTFASSVLSEEVGWDFDNETLSQEHDDSADLSDEVGWDLSDVLPKQKENDSESLTVEVESKEHSDKVQEKEILDDNQTEPKENYTEPQDEREAIAQLCKEKLLLESSTAKLLDNHTSYLTKNQLNLECSLSKALKENKQLVNKLNDSQIILQRIKARVQKLEEQTSVEIITTHAQMQTDSTESVSIGTQSDVKSINVQISPNTEEKVKEFSEEVESPTKTGVSAKAIVYLTREKKQIAKELENLKQKHEEISRMLAEKEESKTKLEQELKLITTAYEQEKESLLHDLEVLKKENITIKQDIQSQTDLRTKCDEFNQKHQEAERLVVELEKDLMRQMEEKTKLNKELIESRSKLTEMSLIEQELHRLRNENRQVEESMGEQLEKYRKENEELLQTLEKRKKPWVSTSPKKVPQVKKRDRVANANNKAQSESQNEDPSSQSAKEIEDKSHSESLEFCDNSIERADSFVDGDAYGGQEKVESVLDEHCGNSFDLSDEKATSEEDHKDNIKNLQQLTFQKNVEQEDQERNRGEQANSDSNQSMTELLEPIDALKERSTMKEDTASEAGFDTDEEAGIEEKLVKILKERQVMELEVQAMVQEMNKLKTKLTKMQSEHEQNNAEQENIKLKTQLDEHLKEKKELDEEVKKIKDRNTQLEMELSEAIEAKTSMEKQLNKLKESGEEDSESETRNDKEVLEFKIKNSELEKQLSAVTVIKHDLEEELKMFRESSTNEAKTMKIDNEDVESQDTQMDIELLIALETQKTLKDEIESLRKSNEQESQSKKEKMDEIKTKNAELEKKLVEVTETKNALENDLKTLKEFNEKKTQSEIEKNEAFEAIKNRNTQLENKLAEFTERNETLENKLKTVTDCGESNQEDERIHEVKARCKKLEEVLSEVVDENSNLFKEVSSLKEQNRMLKTRNIFEISDSSTQVSPMAFESSAQVPQKSFETEECNEKHQTEINSKNRNNETPIIKVSSQEVNESPSGFSTTSGEPGKDHLKLPLESSLKRYPQQNTLSVESKPLSASSPDISSTTAEEKLLRAKNDKQVFSSTAELTLVTPESESGYGGSKGGNTCIRCRKSTCECDSQRKESPEYKNSNDLMSTESVYGSTSADVYIDSSFASATDFDDMSFSSDWVSAEDLRAGRVTARGHHGMNKMHRELAEMKCTNTILENELTILKHRNTDYQSQLQKLAGKNNSLKQKLCERSMLTKKAEREIEALTEDKMRLEVQITSEKEEVNRLEREKSKFERNLTSAKAENKRLKIDLGMVKAENYKNMKHLVKLEGENKKLLSELEETQEELKNTKELLVHFENGSLTSLDDRLSCTSPISTEGMAFSNTGTSVRRDRAGLSLELKSNSHVRRVTSEQSFPRYHGMAKELTTSSVS